MRLALTIVTATGIGHLQELIHMLGQNAQGGAIAPRSLDAQRVRISDSIMSGDANNIWAANIDDEYHEPADPLLGTGRAAIAMISFLGRTS